MKKNYNFLKKPAKFWEIESETVKGKKYIVKLTDGSLSCNCLDFLMRGKESGKCKHIEKVNYKSKTGDKK